MELSGRPCRMSIFVFSFSDRSQVCQPLCLCVVLFVVFIYWEHRRGDTALIPLKLFKNRTMIGATLAAAFTRYV